MATARATSTAARVYRSSCRTLPAAHNTSPAAGVRPGLNDTTGGRLIASTDDAFGAGALSASAHPMPYGRRTADFNSSSQPADKAAASGREGAEAGASARRVTGRASVKNPHTATARASLDVMGRIIRTGRLDVARARRPCHDKRVSLELDDALA